MRWGGAEAPVNANLTSSPQFVNQSSTILFQICPGNGECGAGESRDWRTSSQSPRYGNNTRQDWHLRSPLRETKTSILPNPIADVFPKLCSSVLT